MADLENGQCCSQGCDYFQAKGKNLRWFYEYVAAIIGIMLILFGLGSCLGCEACFDCAAVCDENYGCGLEECGRECDEISDQVFHCDGVNCGDKRGVFSCDGKWDCSTCSGYTVYTIKVVLNEDEQKYYEAEPEDLEEMRGIEVMYPDDKPSDYYTFKGYYTKKSGGTQYVDAQGNFVKTISKSITLYAQYDEINEGEQYTLHFDGNGHWLNNPPSIDVVIGEEVWGMPEVPELEGMTFQGWYTDKQGQGTLVAKPGEDWTFHLVPFNHKPEDWPRAVMLYAHYTVDTFNVRFHYDNGETETETVNYGTLLDSIMGDKDKSVNNTEYYFGGWSQFPNPALTDALDGSIAIMEDYDLYEIRRDWITITFNLGRESIPIKLKEGDTHQIADLEIPGSSQKLIDYVQEVGCNPGYAFDSWRLGSTSGTATYQIIVAFNMTKTIYAKWVSVQYRIEYWVRGDNYSPEAQMDGGATLYNYGARVTLWDFGRWASVSNFKGWYVEGNPDEVFMTLPTDLYGDLKLIAKFE